MGHDHDHGSGTTSGRALVIALALTAAYTVVEVVGGFLTNSLALLADAGHMLSDTFAIGLALVALTLASRPSTPRRSFGFQRAEILAAFVNGLTLVLIAGWIVYEAVGRFRDPPDVLGGWMLLVAVTGLVVNAASAVILARGEHESLNVRAAFRHVLADLLDVRRSEDLLDGRDALRRRLLAAEEVRHERLHARAREEHARVVPQDERRAGQADMTLLLEELEEPEAHALRRAQSRWIDRVPQQHERGGARRPPLVPIVVHRREPVDEDRILHTQPELEARGYELAVFHTTGMGGRAFEDLARRGYFACVMDFSLQEVVNHLADSCVSAGGDRLLGAGSAGIPQIVAPGATDMVDFAAWTRRPDGCWLAF